MTTVTFIDRAGAAHVVSADNCGSLMEAAIENSVPGIDASCGGGCSCATCHVHIDEAWFGRLPPPEEEELTLIEFSDNVSPLSRLSCQIKVTEELDGLVVTVAG